MSFFYQRTIQITRITPVETVGSQSYRSAEQWQEQIIITDLVVNIRQMTRGGPPLPDVPADVVGRGMWRIVFPLNAPVTHYQVHKDDIATDDLGRRFKLMMPDWKSVGGIQIEAELLTS